MCLGVGGWEAPATLRVEGRRRLGPTGLGVTRGVWCSKRRLVACQRLSSGRSRVGDWRAGAVDGVDGSSGGDGTGEDRRASGRRKWDQMGILRADASASDGNAAGEAWGVSGIKMESTDAAGSVQVRCRRRWQEQSAPGCAYRRVALTLTLTLQLSSRRPPVRSILSSCKPSSLLTTPSLHSALRSAVFPPPL